MNIDVATEKAIRNFISRIADTYSIAGVILYGSRARCTHRTDSYVDVALLLNGERKDFVDTKLAMADVAFEVMLETGLRISPLPVWLIEWEHPEEYSDPQLLRNIELEGIRLRLYENDIGEIEKNHR